MKGRKLWVIILIIISVFLMSGCDEKSKGETYVVDDPLSEDEIIKYVQERIHEETGDVVTVEIVSQKQLRKATGWFDGPIGYRNVEGAHEYELKITSQKDKDIVARGYYADGYITRKKNTTGGGKTQPSFSSNYVDRKGFYQVKTEFIHALDRSLAEYYIYEDIGTTTGLDIFICSTDYESMNDLLNSFRYMVENLRDQEYVTYSVYIYKDKEVFDNTEFDLYKNCTQNYGGQSYGPYIISQMTGKQVVQTTYSESFDREVFESDGISNADKVLEDTNPDSYEYIVFYYDAEPNAFVGANSPSLYTLGVK